MIILISAVSQPTMSVHFLVSSDAVSYIGGHMQTNKVPKRNYLFFFVERSLSLCIFLPPFILFGFFKVFHGCTSVTLMSPTVGSLF